MTKKGKKSETSMEVNEVSAETVEVKTGGKGKKKFTLEGDAAKVVSAFGVIYRNLDKKNLAYRGKKGENLVAKKKVKKKNAEGQVVIETVELAGTEAQNLATQRYYSSFGSRVNRRQTDERNSAALEAIRGFVATHSDMDSQKQNGQELLDILMGIYKEERKAGTGKTYVKKEAKALSLSDLGL
jgi:hypothetical protein